MKAINPDMSPELLELLNEHFNYKEPKRACESFYKIETNVDPEEDNYDLETFYITNGLAYLIVDYDDKIDNPMYDVKLENSTVLSDDKFERLVTLLKEYYDIKKRQL